MREVIATLSDGGSMLELKASYAEELVTAFARVEGLPIGIVGNNSRYRGGVLRVPSCDKAVRFISTCASYRVPLVFLADTVGFMVGKRAEEDGIVRAAAKLFVALAAADVPKFSVVVRKALTAGVHAMCGSVFDPEALFAIEGSFISVFGPKAAERFAGGDPEKKTAFDNAARGSTDPESLAAKVIVDEVIPLAALRVRLAARLARLPERDRPRTPPPIWPM
jgi:acetyl-CoA carboxylase carboxyltransferase component